MQKCTFNFCALWPARGVPVVGVIRAGVVGSNYDEDVLELGPDIRDEGKGTGLLKPGVQRYAIIVQ